MPLILGTKLGFYDVVALIGAGGMGEVYRARDGKLNRDVALKVLPDSFANDPERLARFQREAQVLASLNHPNIAHIHGIEDVPSPGSEHGAVRALIMELVEGPTLADRIAQGAIPLTEALPIAKQIADALEAAHAQGIIHRDLKPANIKVRDDGTVKVLDFGLAKAVVSDGASGTANAMNSPTITSPAMMTGAGIILGTAAYMSPEQAKGKAVDKRTDIWAFGCVLFEMLTGRRAFDGEDVTDTLAFIITKDPEWSALPANTPPSIRQLLRRCLEKDRKRRLADIADAQFDFEQALIAPIAHDRPSHPAARRTLPWILSTGVLAAAVLFLGFTYIRQVPSEVRTTRFQVPVPEKATRPMFRLSPDGRMLAITAIEGARTRLWIRPLDSLGATPLAGTDDATYPFWSPDSTHIAFFAQGKLKKIAVGGGPPQTLCNAAAGRGGTWNADGVIVFSDLGSGLSRVAAAGGVPTAVTTKSARTAEVHRFPEFLPGGARFIFTINGALSDANGIFAGSLDGSPPMRILSDTSNAVYVPSAGSGAGGHLLFRREGTLVAQPFDPERLAIVGETFPIAEQIGISVNTLNGAFSASQNGVLVYAEGDVDTQLRELVWIDRTGKRTGPPLGPPGRLIAASLSPNERTVSFSIAKAAGDGSDVWLHDVGRNVRSRLTFRPGFATDAVWSPDGSRVVFGSENSSVYQKPANGAGSDELLLRFGINLRLLDWSPDGRFVVFQAQAGEAGNSLFLLPLEGNRKPIPYLETAFTESDAQFSPDGRWMAYASDESGEPQVYVQAIPANGQKWQISSAGGTQPRWRQDGKELFYLSGDQKLMAVPVRTGAAFETGSPQPLFDMSPVYPSLFGRFAYQPAAAGQRFLVSAPVNDAAPPTITVVLNWQAGLKK